MNTRSLLDFKRIPESRLQTEPDTDRLTVCMDLKSAKKCRDFGLVSDNNTEHRCLRDILTCTEFRNDAGALLESPPIVFVL